MEGMERWREKGGRDVREGRKELLLTDIHLIFRRSRGLRRKRIRCVCMSH